MNFLLPALGLLALASTPFSACLGQDASDSQDEILEHANKSWTGDLDGMTKRGFVRILTVHNPLFFQFEGASKRGLVEEWGKAFEAHLAEEIGRVRSPTVVLIPVARDELLPGLIEGRGDLVMGNLTITPERQKLVDFGPPIHTDISELVVTGPAAQGVASFDDLVQTGVYVRRSSSYFEHLQGLNAERSAQGKPPIPITEADENLEDYDLLDMVNAGILEAVIVDSHKAALWEQVFDRIEVHRDLVVNSGSRIAWALRKGSPELMRSISAFSAKVKKGSLLGNVLIERYLGDAEWLENALASEDRERYEETIEIIQRYAARYDFDWLIIAAQAYQESRLDQDKRSPAGAIGVMQGVKYLHWLRETYYSDASIAPLDRALFSFAAYNAGPGNMQKARRRARRLGFDPNRWFGNVEIGMFRAVSGEPASYVRNIYKYYVTYQGLERSRRAREKALESHRQENASTARTWLAAAALIALLIVLGYRARKRAAASGP
jgi:membrane-bound lytic murein transglycosylase MltF